MSTKKKTYTIKQVIELLKRIQRRVRVEGVRDCKDAMREERQREDWQALIDLEGKIYAYEFVDKDILEDEIDKLLDIATVEDITKKRN